jgi:hypothetical protein
MTKVKDPNNLLSKFLKGVPGASDTEDISALPAAWPDDDPVALPVDDPIALPVDAPIALPVNDPIALPDDDTTNGCIGCIM